MLRSFLTTDIMVLIRKGNTLFIVFYQITLAKVSSANISLDYVHLVNSKRLLF